MNRLFCIADSDGDGVLEPPELTTTPTETTTTSTITTTETTRPPTPSPTLYPTTEPSISPSTTTTLTTTMTTTPTTTPNGNSVFLINRNVNDVDRTDIRQSAIAEPGTQLAR